MKSSVPDYIQNPMLDITITVIGAGGSGSTFLQHLAKVVYAYQSLYNRFISVVVTDGDTISSGNVGRQAYGQNEVGQNKADVIVSRINRFYGFKWLCRPAHFRYSEKKIKAKDRDNFYFELSSNFIVSAVDDQETRRQIKEFFDRGTTIKKSPEYRQYFWIDMGNMKTTGQFVVGSPEMGWPDIMSYQEFFPPVSDDEPSCSLAMALNKQDLFINPQCAMMAAKWLWECLSKPEIDWRGCFINLESQTPIRKLQIIPNAATSGSEDPKQPDKSRSKRTKAVRSTKPAKKGKRKNNPRVRARRGSTR